MVEDTPASEAGIRMGDRILEFDGQPAAQLSVSRLRAALRKPHRRYTVKLERGSAPLTVTLNTRPLLPVE